MATAIATTAALGSTASAVGQASAAPTLPAGGPGYSCGFYNGTEWTGAGQTGPAAVARIKEVQCLINLGAYTPSTGNSQLYVDGNYDQSTYRAVEWYQRCSHIGSSGQVDAATWYQLRNNPNC
ncbi:peptidoglycan-binding domain-containing protein [Embleya sp. AB8]|uniref:peptidoglycan-binding domain-containing protein n=1 Tax=Embleya sp. AB8 TaxID=3156304 RepID=UPI003C755E61